MSVKANLRIVLLANEVTVAESIDPTLWQQTLASITGQSISPIRAKDVRAGTDEGDGPRTNSFGRPEERARPRSGSLEDFADDLQLDSATVQGACDPIIEPPYIHLDVRSWQEFKRNTPGRGSTSVPPIVLAATLLVLWSKKIGLNTITVSQAQAVLNTIDSRDKNPGRGLRNCDWLQTREDNIKLNPAKFDQAIAMARAYCSRQPIETGVA